jgi:aryl-alcohol dehydrogenase-like predicted oxidoreductase
VYGLGHSEEVVGRLLRERTPAERPMVFTKCGLIWDPSNPMAPPQRVLKPKSIRQQCDASLRQLGVERIDLCQFHWPDETGTPVADSWNEMVRLIKEGKVRLGESVISAYRYWNDVKLSGMSIRCSRRSR